VVVVAGLANTFGKFVAERPVAGLHKYVLAPLASRLTVEPGQIVALLGEMVIMGGGFAVTATTTFVVFTQPLLPVPETV
jgi:hypothetical protein